MTRLISVIVPTKNRYKYLKFLIELVESYCDSRIELLVHDNSDDNSEIIEYLSHKNLQSTVYYHDSSKLSMGENAEKGILKSTGKYICFIGDDDAVCRNIVDCAIWMEKNNIEALRSLYLNFCWNEAKGKGKGSVYHDPISFNYELGDPLKEMKKVLEEGVPNFLRMAKIYHGVINRSVFEKIYSIGGTSFPGPTPDMSGAVSISFFIKKYAMIEIPVVLPGMSKMVGGGVMGKVLSLDEVQFISDRDRNNWEADLPRLWATELIWPDCAIKALRYVGRPEYIKYLNKYKMYSRLIAIHQNYFMESLKYAPNKFYLLYSLCSFYIFSGIKHFKGKLMSKINGKVNGRYIVKRDLNGISDAEKYLMGCIQNFNFDKLQIK